MLASASGLRAPRTGRDALRHNREMRIADFALERYFARWEFSVEHLLCASDVQGLPMSELLALADDETRALWDGLTLGYAESSGHPLLRREIAAMYDGLAPEDVLVFAGAEEGIFCLVNVLLGPGDHAVVTWPGYQSLYEIARATGADVTLHELREDAGWALDLDLLRGQVTSATRLIVVNAPHNPTGMLPDRSTFDGLVAIAEEAGAYLLLDEVYRFLEFDDDDRLPAAADATERGVSLGVMSKSFALAGLRIGWLATRDRDLLERCASFKDYTTICASAPSEILAIIGLRARETVLGPVSGDRRREHGAARRVLRRVGRPLHLGASAGRIDRVSAADRAGRRHRRLGRRSGRNGRRVVAAGFAIRLRRQPLPAGVRADRPAGGPGTARRVRGPNASLTRPGARRRAPPKPSVLPSAPPRPGRSDGARAGLARMHRCAEEPSCPRPRTEATTFSLRGGGS